MSEPLGEVRLFPEPSLLPGAGGRAGLRRSRAGEQPWLRETPAQGGRPRRRFPGRDPAEPVSEAPTVYPEPSGHTTRPGVLCHLNGRA